jgi:hypothetical protein
MTFAEQLADATAKLDTLLASPTPVVAGAETTQKMTAAEALLFITQELASATVTKERGAYLKSVLEELAKNNWEQTSHIELKLLNDPMQIKPVTESIGGTLQTLAAASPESGFASNMSALQKVQAIAMLIVNKEELRKSTLTDKMDSIKSMFGLSEEDLKDSYDVRWKIGDLIGVLQDAIKLENFVGGGSAKKNEPTAPVEPTTELVWPHDMASAQFDPVAKAYKKEPLAWGNDSQKS